MRAEQPWASRAPGTLLGGTGQGVTLKGLRAWLWGMAGCDQGWGKPGLAEQGLSSLEGLREQGGAAHMDQGSLCPLAGHSAAAWLLEPPWQSCLPVSTLDLILF